MIFGVKEWTSDIFWHEHFDQRRSAIYQPSSCLKQANFPIIASSTNLHQTQPPSSTCSWDSRKEGTIEFAGGSLCCYSYLEVAIKYGYSHTMSYSYFMSFLPFCSSSMQKPMLPWSNRSRTSSWNPSCSVSFALGNIEKCRVGTLVENWTTYHLAASSKYPPKDFQKVPWADGLKPHVSRHERRVPVAHLRSVPSNERNAGVRWRKIRQPLSSEEWMRCDAWFLRYWCHEYGLITLW